MNPLLDDRQQELRQAAQEAVEANVAPMADRIETATEVPRELLGTLADADLLDPGEGPESLLRTVLVVEQVARKSAALAAVVAGHSVAIAMLREAGHDVDDAVRGTALLAMVTEAVDADAEGNLSGDAGLVCAAADAGVLLVAASGAGAGLYRVSPTDENVTVESAEGLLGLNGSGTARVSFSGAAGERVGDARAASDAADRLRVAQAAVGVGIGRGALDVSVAEVLERREAGDRVDRSQAVQWMLADMATESEAARAATWYAACAAPGAAREEASAMCRLLAAESAVAASRRALQIFGPRGALRGTGVERLYRDAKVLEMQGGSNEQQLARIARHLLPDLAPEA